MSKTAQYISDSEKPAPYGLWFYEQIDMSHEDVEGPLGLYLCHRCADDYINICFYKPTAIVLQNAKCVRCGAQPNEFVSKFQYSAVTRPPYPKD